MTASAPLSASGPEDILGYIPHSLGYWPEESLVAITLQGRRIGATLRVDLPLSTRFEDLEQYARTVTRYLEADRKADGVVLAAFSSSPWEGLPLNLGPLMEALQQQLVSQGLKLRDAWFVGDLYWRDALCRDTTCCPWPGRPREDIRDSRLNAEMILRGSSVEAAPVASPPPLAPLPIGAAEETWLERLSARLGSRAQFVRVLEAWEHVLREAAPDRLSAEQGAYLRAVLRVPAWRDAVLVASAAGGTAALDGAEIFGMFDASPEDPAVALPLPGLRPEPEGQHDSGSGADSAAAARDVPDEPGPAGTSTPGYGDVLLGLAPARPDWKSLDALDLVLQRLAAEGGGPAAAAALTGRGWIAWCRGRGSYSSMFLREAMHHVPDYRLAELLHEMIGRGTLCGWAANPRSAWQKFETDAA